MAAMRPPRAAAAAGFGRTTGRAATGGWKPPKPPAPTRMSAPSAQAAPIPPKPPWGSLGETPPPGTAPPSATSSAPWAPTHMGYALGLQGLDDQIKGLANFYNPQRETSAVGVQNSLVDNGYFDNASISRVDMPGAEGDAVTSRYDVTGGAEGQRFRDLRTSVAKAYSSRRAFGSSAAARDRATGEGQIATARQRILEGAVRAQQESLLAQQGKLGELQRGRSQMSGEYEAWKATQKAPDQPPPAAAPGGSPAPAATPPAAATPGGVPKNGVVWVGKTPPSQDYLQQVMRRKYPDRRASVVRTGDGRYAIKLGPAQPKPLV